MEYAYLGSNIISMSVWALLYIWRQDLRRQMLIMSILAMPLAFFDLLFVPTYWQPVTIMQIPIGIEGFIFSFSVGGIAAVAYAEVTGRRMRKIENKTRLHAVWLPFVSGALFFLCEVTGSPNPEISAYVATLASLVILLFLRKDLLQSAVVGSVAFGLIYLLSLKLWLILYPEARDWFVSENMPKIFFWGVPGWEVLFGFIFAAYWVNLYPLFFGYRFSKPRKNTASVSTNT